MIEMIEFRKIGSSYEATFEFDADSFHRIMDMAKEGVPVPSIKCDSYGVSIRPLSDVYTANGEWIKPYCNSTIVTASSANKQREE